MSSKEVYTIALKDYQDNGKEFLASGTVIGNHGPVEGEFSVRIPEGSIVWFYNSYVDKIHYKGEIIHLVSRSAIRAIATTEEVSSE